jgi:2-phosphosulfolactate phosphatase
MKVSVALVPRLMRDPASQAVAVVDVLRASSSLVTMFERGLIRAIIPDTLRDARALALKNFSLLCGEAKALPLAGFDYGNSPAEFAQLPLRGKSAVLWTTNGTKAIGAVAGAPVVIVAAFTNRRAAALRLVAEAVRRKLDIGIVCAGLDRGQLFSLEDNVAAGGIVEAVRQIAPDAQMADSAVAAEHLWRWYRGDAMRSFRHASHGRALARMGFDLDLEYAARTDIAGAVPVLTIEDGVKTLRSRPAKT